MESKIRKFILTAAIFSFITATGFTFLPKEVAAGCDCGEYGGDGGWWYRCEDGCDPYCNLVVFYPSWDPDGHTNVYNRTGNCKADGYCEMIICSCDTYAEAQSQCSSGGGLDEPPPECADTPLSFYKYGKDITNLITNSSFESRSGSKQVCTWTGCRTDKCLCDPKTSAWSVNGEGWATSSDTGARDDCPYTNDGPDNPNNCDPPEAGCYNNCGPLLGSWQIGTKPGKVCSTYHLGDELYNHCAEERDERKGWHANQLISNLNPGSNYLLLVRARGKGTTYDGGCWGEGWVEARWRSVKADSIKGGDYIYFGVGGHNAPWGDETAFSPTITFTNTSGVTTEYKPWTISDNDFSSQGPIWYYYYGTTIGGDRQFTRYKKSETKWYGPYGSGSSKRPYIQKQDDYIKMYPYWTDLPSVWLRWRAPEDGIAIVSGTVAALADPCDSECKIDVEIYHNDTKIWDAQLTHEGDSANFYEDEDLLEYGTMDTGYYGAKADDYWITDVKTVSSETGRALLDLKSASEECSGWAPRGQADWIQLIELCDTPSGCKHGAADGIVWSVSVENGARSEMQFSNDGGATWGMIADDNGNIVNSGWAPYSPYFYWKPGGATETLVRFWNQRDEQQKVVQCTGASPPGLGDSKILGRIAIPTSSPYTNYFRDGSCSGCSGLCTEASGLSVVCTSGSISSTASWNCNDGGAFYETGKVFNGGQTVTCQLINVPSGYRVVEWGYQPVGRNSCGGDGTSCTATITLDPSDTDGLHDLWFYLETVNPPTCNFTSYPMDCVETGSTISFTAEATDDVGLDHLELWRSPTSTQSWTQLDGDHSCGGTGDTSCTITRTWTPTTAGTYYVTCNAYDSEGAKCSGNPWCPCDGWSDCGSNDYVTVTVQDSCAPPPPSCPPFFCKSFHTWREIK